jgi:hypothetical protein
MAVAFLSKSKFAGSFVHDFNLMVGTSTVLTYAAFDKFDGTKQFFSETPTGSDG